MSAEEQERRAAEWSHTASLIEAQRFEARVRRISAWGMCVGFAAATLELVWWLLTR